MKPANYYFRDEIIEMFDELMRHLGASRVQSSQDLCVRYEKSDWFVEFFALPEDGPKYCPRVAIGPLPELGFLSRDKQVDMMHTLPAGSALSRYNIVWRYTEPATMRAVFRRVWDEIFIPFALPILSDSPSLKSLVQARSSLINREWEEEIKQHNLSIIKSRATKAWEAKDFAQYVEEMETLQQADITELESLKLAFARKRV